MYEDLKERAIENLKIKKTKVRSVHTVGVIFLAVAIILFTISINFTPNVAYWIKFPILVLALFYCIIYFSAFGIPFISEEEELTDEEIGREIVRIFKIEGANKSDSTENDELELKELEALKNKWDDEDEFV